MLAEIREIQASLSLAHTVLSGMTESLTQLLANVFGRNVIPEHEALTLMGEGKRVDI
jgi:hypothetical protein